MQTTVAPSAPNARPPRRDAGPVRSGRQPQGHTPKRPYQRVKLFGSGKLSRLILDALRKAERPLTTIEVIGGRRHGIGLWAGRGGGDENPRSRDAEISVHAFALCRQGRRAGDGEVDDCWLGLLGVFELLASHL